MTESARQARVVVIEHHLDGCIRGAGYRPCLTGGQNGEHRSSGSLGVRQALHDQDHGRVSGDLPVGRQVLRSGGLVDRLTAEVHRPDHGHVKFAGDQPAPREVQRLQAGRFLVADREPQAAEIEESLSAACEAKGLVEKALVHRFSAVSCWAQAGNFHFAIQLGDEMLARPDLPVRLRRQVQEYTKVIRLRRAQWSAELATAGAEG